MNFGVGAMTAVLAVMAGPLRAQEANDPATARALAEANLSIQKETAKGLVELLVARGDSSGAGQVRYVKAAAAYNGYLEAACGMLERGEVRDLGAAVARLTPVAQEAASRMKEFEDFVHDKVKTQGAGLLPSLEVAEKLVRWAVGIFDFFKDRSASRRQAKAAELRKRFSWSSWSEIAKGVPASGPAGNPAGH